MTEFQAALLKILPNHAAWAKSVWRIANIHYDTANSNKGQRSAVSKALHKLWQDKRVGFTYEGYPKKETRYYRRK